MKFLGIIFLVVCAVAVVANAQPAGKKSKPNECLIACTADYNPICGADINDSKSTPRLFSNKCVMSVHNCEHGSNLVEIDKNKCKSAGGIRLS